MARRDGAVPLRPCSAGPLARPAPELPALLPPPSRSRCSSPASLEHSSLTPQHANSCPAFLRIKCDSTGTHGVAAPQACGMVAHIPCACPGRVFAARALHTACLHLCAANDLAVSDPRDPHREIALVFTRTRAVIQCIIYAHNLVRSISFPYARTRVPYKSRCPALVLAGSSGSSHQSSGSSATYPSSPPSSSSALAPSSAPASCGASSSCCRQSVVARAVQAACASTVMAPCVLFVRPMSCVR